MGVFDQDLRVIFEDNPNLWKQAITKIIHGSENIEEDENRRDLLSKVTAVLPKVLAHGNEVCRESILCLFTKIIDSTVFVDEFLPATVKSFCYRLTKKNENTKPFENSEEIRSMMIMLLKTMVEKSSKKTNCEEFENMANILSCTIIDSCPETQKLSCDCTSALAKSTKRFSKAIICSLVKILGHRQYKLRISAILCIGDIVEFGDNESVRNASPHLAQRLFDPSVAVRLTVVRVMGRWIITLNDRLSLYSYLLPLILSSLSDERDDVRSEANTLWDGCGKMFEEESSIDSNGSTNSKIPGYPENVIRPRLGCRILVQRRFNHLITAVLNDLTDWIAETRIQSAKLLWTLILHQEQQLVQHLNQIIPAIHKASSDRESSVVHWVGECGILIGCFVSPSVWVPLISNDIKNSLHGQGLFILSRVLTGARPHLLIGHVNDVMASIFDDDILYNYDTNQQKQLVCCLEVLSSCKSGSAQFKIFFAALSAFSLVPETQEQINEVFCNLFKSGNLDSTDSLFALHMAESIEKLMKTCEIWTMPSHERLIVDSLITQSGKAIGKQLHKVIPMFQTILKSSPCLEIRIKFFMLFSNLLLDCSNSLDSDGRLAEFIPTIIEDITIPNLAWRPGRKATALRIAAITFLWSLLRGSSVSSMHMDHYFENLLTGVLASLEDKNARIRIISLKIMDLLLTKWQSHFDQDVHLVMLYPVLLKCLDDNSDDVRFEALSNCEAMLDCFSPALNDNGNINHWLATYKGLLIYLDDPNEILKSSIFALLKKFSRLQLEDVLAKEVENVQIQDHSHTVKISC